MTTDPKTIAKAFNDQLDDFIADIIRIFPDNLDIQVAKNSVATARSANPRLVITFWKAYIGHPYYEEIKAKNSEFFLNKDYSQDLLAGKTSEYEKRAAMKTLGMIEKLREPIRAMTPSNKARAMKYVENLTDLSMLYGV